MKRYLVFAGKDLYPEGGWSDLVGQRDTEAQARELANAQKPFRDSHGGTWVQIVDTERYRVWHLPLGDGFPEIFEPVNWGNA